MTSENYIPRHGKEPDFAATHDHGYGDECFPGCPAYNIARAFHGAYITRQPEEYEALTWDQLPETEERSIKFAIQALLNAGTIAPRATVEMLGEQLQSADAAIKDLTRQKDAAYAERNQLVAVLAKLFPSHMDSHQGAGDWDDDWRNVVCIHLPTGTVTWYIHDSELPVFHHLRMRPCRWDGHTTQEKYRRLAALDYRGGTPGQGAMTFQDIEDVVRSLRNLRQPQADRLVCHPAVYNMLAKTYPPDQVTVSDPLALLPGPAGVAVIIDPDMREHEWKLMKGTEVVAWFIPTDGMVGIMWNPR